MPRVKRTEICADDEIQAFHLINRCVRRTYLCGKDRRSGKDYSHRKEWIRERLEELAKRGFGFPILPLGAGDVREADAGRPLGRGGLRERRGAVDAQAQAQGRQSNPDAHRSSPRSSLPNTQAGEGNDTLGAQ